MTTTTPVWQQPQQPIGAQANDSWNDTTGYYGNRSTSYGNYDDGQTWYQAGLTDYWNDLRSPEGAFYHLSTGQAFNPSRAISGYNQWDNRRNALRDYQNRVNVGNTINGDRQAISDMEAEQMGWLQQQDQMRRGVLGQIDDAAFSQSRQNEYNQLYQGALGQSLGQIKTQYGQARRSEGFDAVRRGALGGSSDIDANGQINRSQGLATINAEGNAEQMVRSSVQQDNAQFSALRQALLAGDPQALGQLTNQAQGINDLRQGQAQQYQNQLASNQLQQQWYNTQSGYLGSALNAAGNSYRTDQNARAYGGQGLYGSLGNVGYGSYGGGAGNGSSLYGGSITGSTH